MVLGAFVLYGAPEQKRKNLVKMGDYIVRSIFQKLILKEKDMPWCFLGRYVFYVLGQFLFGGGRCCRRLIYFKGS